MTFNKTLDRTLELDEIDCLWRELQCLVKKIMPEVAMELAALHAREIEPEYMLAKSKLETHFPSVFVEKIPGLGIFKGEPQ